MKRIISIALVALMLVALALPVFADDVSFSGDTATDSGNVTVSVTEAAGDPVYKVSVAWNNLDFSLTGATWDADNEKYTGGTWSHTEGTITVTNSSNAKVYVSTDSAATIETMGVKITLDQTSFDLDSATDSMGTAEKSITVELDDENSAPKAANITVATITLTISKTDPNN